jgi:hypothetical protein
MKKIIMVAVLLVSALTVNAQDYNWAVGLRGGYEYAGVTVKKGMDGKAWDFTGNWRFGSKSMSLNVQALYELQYTLSGPLDWYWGVGGHVGTWNNGETAKLWLGLDAVIGLEFDFSKVSGLENIPLALSLDYRPGFHFIPETSPTFGDVGFGLKFCF